MVLNIIRPRSNANINLHLQLNIHLILITTPLQIHLNIGVIKPRNKHTFKTDLQQRRISAYFHLNLRVGLMYRELINSPIGRNALTAPLFYVVPG